MELSLDDIKLLVGGLALDIVSRDKTINLLTEKINQVQAAQVVREFPKEVKEETKEEVKS